MGDMMSARQIELLKYDKLEIQYIQIGHLSTECNVHTLTCLLRYCFLTLGL